MNQEKVKIGFIGAGSIGSLFGGYLASIDSKKDNLEVILFCRKSHANAIKKKGLILQKDTNKLVLKNIEAFENLEHYEKFFPKKSRIGFDYLFLTTKTYDMESAAKQYTNLIINCKKFIILQNGIGNEEIIKNYCPMEKIVRIVTTNGALSEQPGCVIHTGKGITKIGIPFKDDIVSNNEMKKQGDQELKLLVELLNQSGLKTIFVEDIIRECWEKVFVNIGINAFGALTDLNNGDLLKIDGLKKLMGDAVKEAYKVAKINNINLLDKDYIALAYDVAEKTSKNKNSMLQDIIKGKKTEIDFINGKIVSLAKEMKVPTPINEVLTYLIKGLEKSKN